jgi:choline dehydrogenase-like flavoprotein
MSGKWDFDAIVVGSGFAGAVTACRLSEAEEGFRVCILERGRRYLASDLPVLGREEPGHACAEREPDRSAGTSSAECGFDRRLPDFTRAFWALGQGLWDVRDLGELVVAQAAGYGGGSLIYANVHLRAPEKAFEKWPEKYRGRTALDPYYDLAAYMLDVKPMPKAFPKTAQLRRAGEALGRRVFDPPLAINFGPHQENRFGVKQGICDMRGECCFGCRKQAKNTLDLNYLALAEQRGVEVRTLAEVVSIEPAEKDGEKGYELGYLNHLARGRRESISARHVFLCAGAVNTTELLLRNREALGIRGHGLGTRFHPNADALAVAFDCDEPQEADRGPTITSSLVYDDGESFLLVQDGGMPAPLEPLLGVFRSPLWLHRNGFEARARAANAASRQKLGYAELPFASLVDVFSTVTTLPLGHEVGRAMLALARGRPEPDDATARRWALYPLALKAAFEELRDRGFDDAATAAEPTLERLLESTAAELARSSAKLLAGMGGDLGRFEAKRLAEWALRLGVQLLWGSQAGLVGRIGRQLQGRLLPESREILGWAADLLRWALDYRWGDGHSAVLLSMGCDSSPWHLALDHSIPPAAGSRIVGARSGAEGVLVSRSDGALVLTDVTGRFEKGECLLADDRAFGICESDGLEALRIDAGGHAPASTGGVAAATRLGALRFGPLPFRRDDPRRFRTDLYRSGRIAAQPPPSARPPEPPLRARLTRYGEARERAGEEQEAVLPERRKRGRVVESPERQTQELLLRDIARELGGELRTDPVSTLLDRRVTVHAQGGAPMAEDEAHGVTDPLGRVFGCDGLYVMDAAAFPAPVGVNPSASIAAVAEFKVANFLSENYGESGRTFTAREQADAIAWAREAKKAKKDGALLDLDPLGEDRHGPQPDRPPEHEPIGIEFEEVMKGTHRPYDGGGSESAITTRLRVTVPDLASFLERNRRGRRLYLGVEGNVEIEGIESIPPTEIPVRSETSFLRFSGGRDPSGSDWGAIEYRLEFAVDDRTYVLDGIKDIRDDERFDVWEDTTTLTFTLARQLAGEEAEVEPLRRGVLRLPVAEFFGGQLRLLEVTHADHDPAQQIWAFSSFARFFFTHLVDVYVPALDRVIEVGRVIAGRGHV